MEKSSLTEGAIILLVCLYMAFVKVIFMSIGDAIILFLWLQEFIHKVKENETKTKTPHTEAKTPRVLKSYKDAYRQT